MPAGPPDAATLTVPEPVLRLAGGRSLRPVWRNELDGLTFQIGVGPDRCFVKWAPTGSTLDLAAEAARMTWAAAYTPVPRPLDLGATDDGAWLLTTGLPGDSAVSPRWLARPEVAARGIGAGLRAMHDALPVDTCPFSWAVPERVAEATGRGADTAAAAALAAETPVIDVLVVCHGDACAPNTLLTDDGRWSGHVDLGALGVADRWADIAVATWSTQWNYGPGWEDALLQGYGVAPDPARTSFYRRLWDLDG